jgi:hypothetical protein
MCIAFQAFVLNCKEFRGDFLLAGQAEISRKGQAEESKDEDKRNKKKFDRDCEIVNPAPHYASSLNVSKRHQPEYRGSCLDLPKFAVEHVTATVQGHADNRRTTSFFHGLNSAIDYHNRKRKKQAWINIKDVTGENKEALFVIITYYIIL